MAQSDITIRKIRLKGNLEQSTFLEAYETLLLKGKELADDQAYYLLKLAVLFINSIDNNVKQLGYGIILRYSNRFGDYKPLYDVALALDYIPITKFIEENHFKETDAQSFSSVLRSAYQENFKVGNDSHHTYRSKGQMLLNHFAENNFNLVVVAPTSYGKSEIIVQKVQDNIGKKICILVPSKALLAQTKKNLLNNEVIKENFKKIITHPDMFRSEDESFIAVLTQERFLSLLQKDKGVAIDLICVDEAHNLLEDETRAHLLAQVLLIAQKRNPSFIVNFFTPFLRDAKSLEITNQGKSVRDKLIDENLKVERFYTFDSKDRTTSMYDQFLARSFPLKTEDYDDDVSFILSYKSDKNIVYLNRPMNAEQVASALAEKSLPIELNRDLQKVIDSISDLIHKEYNLLKCLRKGIVYHHGGIPDIIRMYIEDVYSRYEQMKFIVSTSTLLEGVNIPASSMFLLTPKIGKGHLSSSQFKNLIGRVCRFREIFHREKGDLKYLEPIIYIVKGNYSPKNFSLESFLSKKANASIIINDDVSNPMLKHTVNKGKALPILEYLENIEPGSSGLTNVLQPASNIGRLCFENNVYHFDILKNEPQLVVNLAAYGKQHPSKIDNAEALISAIVFIFFTKIELYDNDENIERFIKIPKAQNFYKMFIEWRSTGTPYKKMINSFLNYWDREVQNGNFDIYVGKRWGEETRGGGHHKLWVDMNLKSPAQRVNLAIAKIKEEQEFIDFHILKYVEILYSLEIMDDDFYDQVKYGTSDKKLICMLKNGFSIELAKLLMSSYSEYLHMDLKNDIVDYEDELIDKMHENEENDVLIFEAQANL